MIIFLFSPTVQLEGPKNPSFFEVIMAFYTKIIQEDITFIYSHNSHILYMFPELYESKKVDPYAFWRRLQRAKELARIKNIDFTIKQYDSIKGDKVVTNTLK